MAQTTHKKRIHPTALAKAALISCMILLTIRNFSLHNSIAAKLTEEQTEREFARKKKFAGDGGDGGEDASESDGGARNAAETDPNNVRLSRRRRIVRRRPSTDDDAAIVPSDPAHLPRALRPPTFRSCCPMLTRPPKKPKCGEVCLTENACNSSLYPYSSSEEREFLRPSEGRGRETLRERCNERNGRMRPPHLWCQNWRNDSATARRLGASRRGGGIRFRGDAMRRRRREMRGRIDPYAAQIPPPGCSAFNNGGGSGSFQHLILFPGAKMAFCGIPKVGITQWMQFLRFTFGAKDYLSSPHIKPEVFAMRYDKMNEKAQREILNDPEWKFVAFLRDPAERLLSAYLDKVATKKLESEHFQKQHGLNRTLSFDEFLSILAEKPKSCPAGGGNDLDRLKGVNWCTNPHWRPQTYSCGMSEFLPRFSFIGSLNHIETQVRTILKEVGLWDNYGKWYHWHKNKKDAGDSRCSSVPPAVAAGERLFGFQQKPESDAGQNSNATIRASDTGYGHATDSRSKMDKYYNSPEMLEKVKQLYEHDYQLWELVNQEELRSGKELAMSLSEECRERAVE